MKLQFLILLLIITTAYSQLFKTLSGRTIPLAAVHYHIPSVSEHVIPHILFEFNRQDSSICNHFVSINITLLTDTIEEIPNDQPRTIVHSGHDYTFAFDIDTVDLIAAWGPSFRLHPLNSALYPNIFLNSATHNQPTIDLPDGSTVDRVAHEHAELILSKSMSRKANLAESCPIQKEISVKSYIEPSFRKMFENNRSRSVDVIHVLYHRISNLFMSVACIRIYIAEITILTPNHNTPPADRFYEMPRSEDVEICARDQVCDLASFLLDNFHINGRSVWRVWVFFTGYNVPHSPLAGAAFRGQLCLLGRNKLWVDGHDDAVIAHEIGHLLGASHDKEGSLMRKELNPGEPLRFSENSKTSIRRFVNRDKRSWCLRFLTHKRPNPFYDYFSNPRYLPHTLSIVPGGGLFTMVNIEPLFLPYTLPTVPGIGLFSLMNKKARKYPTYSYVHLQSCRSYRNTYPIGHNRSVSTYNGLQSLPVESFDKSKTEIAIAFGYPKNSKELLMFVLFSRQLDDQERRRYEAGVGVGNIIAIDHLRYRVGFGFNKNSGKPPSTWGQEMEIQFTHYEPSKYIYKFAMTAGDIRQTGSDDLIVMYELYEHTNNQRRTTTYYVVGSDISPIGEVRSGWSDPVEVPNLFSFDDDNYNALMVHVFDMKVSVVDLDGNGRPDIVIYYYLETHLVHTRDAFIRVGFDLDSNGHATGGWSDLKPISEYNSLVVAQLSGCLNAPVDGSYTPGTVANRQLQLDTYVDSITENLLSTVKSHTPFEDASMGCRECFVGWALDQCLKKQDSCASTIDEVHYTANYKSSPRLSSVTNRQLNESDSFISGNSVHPWKSNGTQSLFCLGFQYMIRNSSFSCDIVDRERVISKGIEISFLKELEGSGVISRIDIDIQTLFADPKGGHGHNVRSIAAELRLKTKSTSRRKAIRQIVNRFRRRKEFSGGARDRLKWEIFEKGGKQYIRFYFTYRHFNETPDFR